MKVRGSARRAVSELPDLVSLLVFFTVTAILFRSVQFALVVTASLGFHELGHAAALAWYGLDSRISFGVMGAWTRSSLKAREHLSHMENALIHLSGPVFSFLLALLAMGLQVIWRPGDQHLLTLASFSAQVGLLNLLPLGSLTDGGKIVRRMIFSLDRPHRALSVFLPLVATVLLLLVDVFEHLQDEQSAPFLLGLLLVGLWMACSMIVESYHEIRAGSSAPSASRPMTSGEVYYLVLVMWALLVLGFIISADTPFWLTPEYVIGSLRNIAALLHLIQRVAL